MTRKIFFLLFLLFPLFAHAQMDSSRFIVRFNGGYADTGSSNGVATSNALTTNNSSWNVGLTIGLPFGKRWEAGVGFEYWKQKTETVSTVNVLSQWDKMQTTKTDMKVIIGKAYVAGRWKLSSKLYFNPILSVGIGKIKSTQAAKTFLLNLPENFWLNGFVGDNNYFSLDLAPTFSYYLTKHFALNLETGSFGFSTTDWKRDNKQWLANVNPVYWKLGIIVLF